MIHIDLLVTWPFLASLGGRRINVSISIHGIVDEFPFDFRGSRSE